jgi:hypothetical protein
MSQTKYLYWAFQSSQIEAPKEDLKKLFQNKYKKDFEKRELFEDEELDLKFRLNGWRNALFSQVTSIILGFESKGTLRVKYIEGSEKDLLQNFVNLVRNQFQDYTLVHFDAGIVLPYMGVRLQKNGFINSPHLGLKYQGYRPWDLKGLCIKQYFKGAGDYSYSLEEIGHILNVDSEGIIPYEDEFTFYASGRLEELNNSAIKKIEVLSQVHRILFQLPQLETVIVKETVVDVVEDKPTDWLKELSNLKQLTPEIKEGLKLQVFNKARISKKDKEIIFELIRASLSEITPNFGSITNEKEVDNIINQLKEELGC